MGCKVVKDPSNNKCHGFNFIKRFAFLYLVLKCSYFCSKLYTTVKLTLYHHICPFPMAFPLTCLLCGWPMNTKQLEYVEESKQHMHLEPLALDQSWQHHLAMTFRRMVEVLIKDGFYRTHLCEDYNCQACNILW